MAGGIVSYEVGRKQYIAVASGSPLDRWIKDGHIGSPTILVFALP